MANAASIHTLRWVGAIEEQGCEVHLASFEPVFDNSYKNVIYHPLPFNTNLKYFLAAPYVRRLIDKIQPELLHAHYASGYGTTAALTQFKPVILSIWGGDVFVFPKRSLLHKKLLEFNFRRANILLSTSHVMAREIGLYTNKSVIVTPFGIDTQRFKPQPVENPFGPENIIIGTVKSLEEWYGIDYLLEACKILKERYSTLPLRFLIVGGGTQELYLKRLACELGIENQTIFTGPVPYEQVPYYHNLLTVFVAVSLRESFGVSVIEASACGKPVVVSNVDGLPEVVEDGVTGFVVNRCDPLATADAIGKLISNQNLQATMGSAGVERIRRLYNWDTNVAQMIEIYRTTLQT